MFAFAYGLGTLLILAGTFSGFVSSLPKSGSWMVWTKGLLTLTGLTFISAIPASAVSQEGEPAPIIPC